jgi:hypothetical protein
MEGFSMLYVTSLVVCLLAAATLHYMGDHSAHDTVILGFIPIVNVFIAAAILALLCIIVGTYLRK